MPDVLVPPSTDGPAIPAYARLEPGARRGVVVLHEIFGRMPDIDRVADRFAAAGYAAVAPDLFHAGWLRCVRQATRDLAAGHGPLVDQVMRTRAWLCAETGIAVDRVGVIGFCIGGSFALLVGRGWGAVSTNYGRIPDGARLDGLPPVIGCYGGRDRMVAGTPERLGAALGDTPHEIHVFPDAGHAFLTDGDHPVMTAILWPYMHPGLHAPSADVAWERIFAFFDRHLG